MKHGVTNYEDGQSISIPSTIQNSQQVSVETPSVALFSRASKSID